MSYLIRPARNEDLEEILQIEKLCFEKRDAYDKSTFQYFLSNKLRTIFLVAIDNKSNISKKEIVGFIVVFQQKKTTFEIITIDVHPEWQNKGIGTKLMVEIENKIHELFKDEKEPEKPKKVFINLVVYESNNNAKKLYLKLNYFPVKILKNYYSGKRNGLLMTKEIELL